MQSDKKQSKHQRPFAVFDIDGTLIRWQLFHAIVHGLGKAGYISPATHAEIKTARMHWKNRESNEGFKSYERLLVKSYIAALPTIPPAEYQHVVDAVIEEYKDQTFTYTRSLIRELKGKGYVLFAISGSQQEAVNKLAEHHGFDAVVGARLEQKNGAFTGVIDTPIKDKKAALERLVAEYDVTSQGSYGVGDSQGDVAMLEITDHPIVINPDQALFAIAAEKRWPIVVERKNVVYQLRPGADSYALRMPDNTKEDVS